jgi:WD40 repeat protein
MDKLICFWTLDRLELNKKLEGHKKGVYTLEWAEDIASLFSGGIEHDISIWNPYVAVRISTLSGHNHSLVKLKYLPGTYQLISADISGMVRVWDVRTFMPVQTFNVPLNEVHSLEVLPAPKMIVVGGKRLLFYDYDEPTDNNLADDESCLAILYNDVFFTFVTAHPKSVKVWDAETGKLMNVFRDLTTREITSICLDKRQRKLFVGDSKGRVFSINVKNGAVMKKFARHADVTSAMVYCGETTRLMTGSWDRFVLVHDDSQSESQNQSRFKFPEREQQINCLAYNPKVSRLASCADDRLIMLYDLKTYRPDLTLKGHTAEVKCCLFLGNFGCLASGDMLGFIHFWTVEPCPNKGSLYQVVQNSVVTETHKTENYPIKAMAFDEANRLLYTGDDMGYMQIWNCSDLVQKVSGITKQSLTFMTEPPDPSQQTLVTLVKQVRAHDEGITSICYVANPSCIATCGYDCKAYVWSTNFEKLGSLLIGGDRHWKLQVSKMERLQEQKAKSNDLIHKLSGMTYETLFRKQTGPMTKEEIMSTLPTLHYTRPRNHHQTQRRRRTQTQRTTPRRPRQTLPNRP